MRRSAARCKDATYIQGLHEANSVTTFGVNNGSSSTIHPKEVSLPNSPSMHQCPVDSFLCKPCLALHSFNFVIAAKVVVRVLVFTSTATWAVDGEGY